MLPKEKRLNISKSFKFVSTGTSSSTASFKLFYRVSGYGTPLVGIAMSKRQFRKANQRNKAKRLSSLAIENLYGKLRMGLNLVIMPKESIFKKDQEGLVKELVNVKALFVDN